MPAFHATVGQTCGDMMPRWTNPGEVLAVKAILKLLRANPDVEKPPTLAVLSPYSRQVKLLSAMIAEGVSSELSHLEGFRTAAPGGFCGTVDSFQGDEADIVIVSLVRNNDHSNPQNALGFLTEIRRMNVLLSRAKWQLVIVGSIKFLETIVAAAKQPADAELLGFMKLLTEWLRKPPPEHAAAVRCVPFATLSGTQS
jgi:superfamily I DNA and/or RNA helicase